MKTLRAKVMMLFIIYFIGSGSIFSQAQNKISPQQMKKDFSEFLKFVDAHPDPYTHVSEQQFQSKIETVRTQLETQQSEIEFYKKLSSITALIKDGHSRVLMPKYWLSNLRKDRGVVPLKFHLNNQNELFVVKKYTELNIPVGSHVTAINGLSIDSFINTINPFISYELAHFRNSLIEHQLEFYLYLVFGENFNLTLEYFSTETNTIEIPLMSLEEFKKNRKENQEEREKKMASGKPYQYKKLYDGIGMIELYGFYTDDIDGYQVFLQKTFKQIRKDSVHSLIIDLRENLGGWPKISSYLFHYLSDTHFKTMARSKMKVSDAYRKFFLEKIPLEYSSQMYARKRQHSIDLQAVMKAPLNTYVEETEFFNERPDSKKYEFKGDSYLLMDRRSFSAASSFAATFQCYRMGHIIGEETGGTKIFRANAIRTTLPKSRLGLSISTTIDYCACYNEELEGVKPDFSFVPSVLDLCSDNDTQLFYALRVIKKLRKKKASMKN